MTCGGAETSRVLVLCATNRPEALDEAVLRRLPSQYKIPMPNLEGRKSILKVLFQPDRKTGVKHYALPNSSTHAGVATAAPLT